MGPGNSDLRNILPEAYSDFIFCIIWEHGIFGAAFVIAVYIAFLFAVGKIARETRSVYKKSARAGHSLIITLRSLYAHDGSTNLFPLRGRTYRSLAVVVLAI